jgi:D-lactate dehydrogenase
MNTTFFSTQAVERSYLHQANADRHQLQLLDARLGANSVAMAQGSSAVSVFTVDMVSAPILEQLCKHGVHYLLLRATGSENIDLAAAHRLGVRVANIPDYSPHATAEYTVALVLALCRHLRQAGLQLRANDFSLSDLVGFDLYGKTVGILGVGRIGAAVARILHGFGCIVLGHDVNADEDRLHEDWLRYVPLAELCAQADIITVHTPLTDQTQHLINDQLLAQMKRGVLLINTGRGGVLDTEAALRALETGQLGFLGLDVYEREEGLFFARHCLDQLRDKTFERLLTFPNVLVTGHQAYLTREALTNIADATMACLDAWGQGRAAEYEL